MHIVVNSESKNIKNKVKEKLEEVENCDFEKCEIKNQIIYTIIIKMLRWLNNNFTIWSGGYKMEYVIEFILELLLEGGLEVTKKSKFPKPIRYIILTIIALLFITVISVLYLTAFLILKQSILGFILFFLLATFILISSIIKFKKEYIEKNNK